MHSSDHHIDDSTTGGKKEIWYGTAKVLHVMARSTSSDHALERAESGSMTKRLRSASFSSSRLASSKLRAPRPRLTSLPKDDRAEAIRVKVDRAPKSFGGRSDEADRRMAERRTTENDGRLRDDGSEGDVRLETLRVLHLLGMNPFCMFRQQGRHRRLANDWRAPNLPNFQKLRGVWT